jgi:4-hydroxyphenylacetate 3-monooxygenase
MLRTGKEHSQSLRDGRAVYIGGERVDDVTAHPAFRNAAATVAALYDMKSDPASRDLMSYEEDGGRHSIYFLRARSRQDLQRRMLGHRRIADFTYGLFGRSPDHVASFIAGMAMKPDELKPPCGHAGNLCAPITATRATTTSTSSTRWCRRRPRAIRNSISGRTLRCRRCGSFQRTIPAWSFPA